MFLSQDLIGNAPAAPTRQWTTRRRSSCIATTRDPSSIPGLFRSCPFRAAGRTRSMATVSMMRRRPRSTTATRRPTRPPGKYRDPVVGGTPNPSLQGGDPLGQVNLYAYFRDRYTRKTFCTALAIFDSRFGADLTYSSFVLHDGATPFASMPLNGDGKYAAISPYSSTFSGTTWTGLRFFRGHITQERFRRACRTSMHSADRSRASILRSAPALEQHTAKP